MISFFDTSYSRVNLPAVWKSRRIAVVGESRKWCPDRREIDGSRNCDILHGVFHDILTENSEYLFFVKKIIDKFKKYAIIKSQNQIRVPNN